LPRRTPTIFLLMAVVIGLGCMRLGFWQVSRLAERKASNALVASRLDAPPVAPDQLPADTSEARYRRVLVSGTFDYEHELVLGGRTRNGSPGINFLTPLRLPGRDTAIIVNRGWVYAPDAMSVELARWREPDPTELEGFSNTFHDATTGEAAMADHPGTFRYLDHAAIAAALPYPVADYYVVASTPPVGSIDSVPVRLPPPPLDEGPHLSYALQWFSFALISFGGAGVFWWGRREDREQRVVPPAPELPRG
jgi:surfeit locus 1 family protein